MALLLAHSRSGGDSLPFFLLLATVGIGIALTRSSRRKKTLAAAAAQLGGVVSSSFFETPKVFFAMGGVNGELTCISGGRNRGSRTRLWFSVVPTGRLLVEPEGVTASIRKVFGAQDIELGDGPFDRSYLIQGAPERWVREVLDPDARRSITRIMEFSQTTLGWGGITVEAGPAGVSITCARDLVDRADLLTGFIRESLALLGRIRGAGIEGITILSTEERPGRGFCPVCANPLDLSPQRCPDCRTPHHPECWSYFGGCAVYGCSPRGGRRRAA